MPRAASNFRQFWSATTATRQWSLIVTDVPQSLVSGMWGTEGNSGAVVM